MSDDAADLKKRLDRIGWTVTSSECWEFNGARNEKNYGRIWLGSGKTRGAHRVSYEAHVGPILAGMSVLHRCDNPPCVNPAHLFLGTIADNNADMHRKGRARIGESHPNARLADSDVRAVLVRHEEGASQRAIAQEFGVAQSTIADIIHHRFRRSASLAA